MGTMRILNNMNDTCFQILNVETQGKKENLSQNKLISRCRNLCHGKF